MIRSCTWLCILPFILTSPVNQFKPPFLYNENIAWLNNIYYKKCAPKVTCDPKAVYRTINGSCNNLVNPSWGSSMTPFHRVAKAVFADGDHEIRVQSDGSELPGPREVHLTLFLDKTHDIPDTYNYHVNQFGQWSAHDITLSLPILEGPENCCTVPVDDNIPYQCQSVIITPFHDPIYSKTSQRCIEFRRAMTAAFNFNCNISPQIPVNQASPFIDASQLYGHTPSKAATLRTYKNGKLKTDIINGHEFCPLLKRNRSLVCDGRNNVNSCFDGGDPRVNQHFGLTIYQTMFTRFHNFLAHRFQTLNPKWSDEKLYQEVRKFIGAANQIMIYRDYLPILLGKSFTDSTGLALRKHERTQYNSSIVPQLTVEFSGSAFRVQHNILPSKYNFIDDHYNLIKSVKLNEWMSKPDPLIKGSNFDYVLRGMAKTPGRAPSPSYNFLISNFMSHFFDNGDQDLLSIDIQRGRDFGVPTYNTMRQLCGFSKASCFEDLRNIISNSDIKRLKTLYATVDDVDLIVGVLLESPFSDAMVGPTARCIISDVFYRLRYGDRFFFDVEKQPGSFSRKQLNALSRIDLGHIFCATSGIDEIPVNIFNMLSPSSSEIQDCHSHLSQLDDLTSAWKKNPK